MPEAPSPLPQSGKASAGDTAPVPALHLAPPLPPALPDAPVPKKSRTGLIVGLSVAVILGGIGIAAVHFLGPHAPVVTPPVTPSADPTASAPEPSATASVAAVVPPPSASAAVDAGPPPKNHFNKRLAMSALDKVGKNLSECRRTKGLWGIGGATIYFANDGTIDKLDVGPPFRGTPEGTCVTDRLMTAKIGPFAGPAPAVVYNFVVPLWPTPVPKPKASN